MGAGEGLDGVLLGGAGAGRLNKPLRIQDIAYNNWEMTYRVLKGSWRVCIVAGWSGNGTHLVPDIASALLVEFDDFHHSLRVFLLFHSGNTALLKQLLPFLWQSGELSSGRVEANVGEVDRIIGSADRNGLGWTEQVRDEA